MFGRIGIALVVTLTFTAFIHAQNRADALAVIDRAIKAHGGEQALARAALAVRSGTGVMTLFGKEMAFTDEVTMNLPDRFRIGAEIDKKTRLTIVLNGDKGWQSIGGQSADLPPARIDELREEAYVLWLGTVLPLKQESLTLKPLGDVTLSGRKTSAIKVSSKGHQDAVLYFDKENNLLVQISRKAQEAGLEVDKDYQFSEHKETDGGKLPTRIKEFLGGKKFSELTSAKYQFLRKADEALFVKP